MKAPKALMTLALASLAGIANAGHEITAKELKETVEPERWSAGHDGITPWHQHLGHISLGHDHLIGSRWPDGGETQGSRSRWRTTADARLRAE